MQQRFTGLAKCRFNYCIGTRIIDEVHILTITTHAQVYAGLQFGNMTLWAYGNRRLVTETKSYNKQYTYSSSKDMKLNHKTTNRTQCLVFSLDVCNCKSDELIKDDSLVPFFYHFHS